MAEETVYGPVITALITGLFGWFLFSGFRSGSMRWGYFGLGIAGDRRSEPRKFWAATVLNGLPFALGLIATVGMLLWPHGIDG